MAHGGKEKTEEGEGVKDFFKPSLPKLVIFFLISFFIPYPYFVECLEGISYFFCVDKWALMTVTSSLEYISPILSTGKNLGTFVITLILTMIYSLTNYTVACLINSLYNRMKK